MDKTDLHKFIDIQVTLGLSVNELELSTRALNILEKFGIKRVVDLVSMNETEFRRLPGVGERVFREVDQILNSLGLSLGMNLSDYVDQPRYEDDHSTTKVGELIRTISQSRLGANFEVTGDEIKFSNELNEDDVIASSQELTIQLHHEALRKLSNLREVIQPLANQSTWAGLISLVDRFATLISTQYSNIPTLMGLIYSNSLELGSYLELDNTIKSTPDHNANPLDPAIRRILEDSVRTIAPWARLFPTIRALDDETDQFMLDNDLKDPAAVAIQLASKSRLISGLEVAVVEGLLSLGEATKGLRSKSSKRGILSVRNLAILSLTIATNLVVGAISSDIAGKSILAQRAGNFIVAAEKPVLQLVADLPVDIRLAVEALIKECGLSR